MLSRFFLGISLVGAEWVLYVLLILSLVSISLIIERARFYSQASKGLDDFRRKVRDAVAAARWDDALQAARARTSPDQGDLEAEMTVALITQRQSGKLTSDVLTELAHDAVMRAKLGWETNLAVLATIGSNAPFIGLFGTVLGIIKAFHDLSQQATAGASMVTSGISEALVATAIGLLVAIPAVIAFNIFQRRVKAALTQAEAMKSFLVGKLAG